MVEIMSEIVETDTVPAVYGEGVADVVPAAD